MTTTTNTPKLTVSGVMRELRELGYTMTRSDGEYRVVVKGGDERGAYYTVDLADALETGRAMHKATAWERTAAWGAASRDKQAVRKAQLVSAVNMARIAIMDAADNVDIAREDLHTATLDACRIILSSDIGRVAAVDMLAIVAQLAQQSYADAASLLLAKAKTESAVRYARRHRQWELATNLVAASEAAADLVAAMDRLAAAKDAELVARGAAEKAGA